MTAFVGGVEAWANVTLYRTENQKNKLSDADDVSGFERANDVRLAHESSP
jgi:hypothetical protein